MMNNLTVDHHAAAGGGGGGAGRLLKQRKSVIGRLDRSSFQAQRLSDVGIAFSQQITAKVGLRLPASQERIVEQTRWLYLRYLFVKLRQNKLPLKDLNLTKGSRARRAAALLSRATLARGAAAPESAATSNPSSPIVCVSVSEPTVESDTLTPLSMDQNRAPFTGPPPPRLRRTRGQSILSIELNEAELSLLNARMSARRSQHLGAAPAAMPPENMPQVGARCREAPPSEDQENCLAQTPPSSDAKRMLFGGGGISVHGKSNINQNGLCRQEGGQVLKLQAPQPAATTTPPKKYIMDPTINNQILTVIGHMIQHELRDAKPEFYGGDTIYEMIGLDKFSSLESLLDVQRTICQEMTRHEISWDRVVALLSLSGAMSLDCVRLGAPEHAGPILDGFIGFVERDLAQWISQQGGWESFLYKYRADFRYGSLYKAAALALPLLLGLLFAYN